MYIVSLNIIHLLWDIKQHDPEEVTDINASILML